MPEPAGAQPPGSVELALVVDDDADGAGAADFGEPARRFGGGGVRDCDHVDVRVAVCEGAEGAHCVFGDCFPPEFLRC